MGEFGIGISMGFAIALMGVAFILLPWILPITEQNTIDKVIKSQHACPNPYYYYGNDDHKSFCDKIHVAPVNATIGGKR